jgi:hypothetical protein
VDRHPCDFAVIEGRDEGWTIAHGGLLLWLCAVRRDGAVEQDLELVANTYLQRPPPPLEHEEASRESLAQQGDHGGGRDVVGLHGQTSSSSRSHLSGSSPPLSGRGRRGRGGRLSSSQLHGWPKKTPHHGS